MVIASGILILNGCDMCYYVLRGGNDIWWCSECGWGICSSECVVAAADWHHAATQWRQCTKEQPVRIWVTVCGQSTIAIMQQPNGTHNEPKSMRSASRIKSNELSASGWHYQTTIRPLGNLKRKRTARRIPYEMLPWLACEHSLIYSCVRLTSFLRQTNSKPPHQSYCVPR